jgi:DNA polymerase (family 10)
MLPDQIARGMMFSLPRSHTASNAPPVRRRDDAARIDLVTSDLTNAEIADRLSLFAALLELAESSPFAARAYARAAELIRSTPAPVADLVREGRVRELRGIGPGIESKLRELVATGEIAELTALQAELPPELVSYARLHGVNVKRISAIARALGIATVPELQAAVAAGRLREVPGIGPATESAIASALAAPRRDTRGLTVNRSRSLSREIADAVGGHMAGAARRFAELTSELTVVVPSDRPDEAIERFEALPWIVTILERDDRRTVGLTLDGVPVTLVVTEPDVFGTELLRTTGSPDWVADLGTLPDAADEESLFAALGLPFCPPELRELPGARPPETLVDLSDIRGDLHCHTTWSDGKASVREMATAARDRGYAYVAICDHTPNVGVVPGLGSDDLRRQGEEIASVNADLAPFRVLRGVECDIRSDGSLDVEDDVLRELDWVQLSLHAGQRRSRDDLTRIVTEAMRHPAVRALSHPTGRILNHRPENALDLDEVFAVANETGVALEVNGLPDRLDLSAAHTREALAAGVRIVLNSDAHSAAGLASLEFALATVRKAGATIDAVVNTSPLAAVVRPA